MEGVGVGDSRRVWGTPPAGIYVIPRGLPPEPSLHGAIPVSQQPVMILQQLPGPMAALTPTTRPPDTRGDLMELMMIQNSQMHQVVMNSLAVAALTSFGFGPSPTLAQVVAMPGQTGEEEDPVVFHHHYIPQSSPAPVLAWPARGRGPVAVRYLGTSSLAEDEELVVPPPPPPSATGTVGANVPPAS
ncbi:PRR29 protein, partial [Hemiprocne comata]|nr:PRR29 protein [Hemiprocne comata]